MATATKSTSRSATKDVSTDDLMAQVDALRSDFSAITDILAELGLQTKDDVKTRAQDMARDARSRAEHEADVLKQRAGEATDSAMEAVRRQPATAVGLAVGFGFLIGFLTSRR